MGPTRRDAMGSDRFPESSSRTSVFRRDNMRSSLNRAGGSTGTLVYHYTRDPISVRYTVVFQELSFIEADNEEFCLLIARVDDLVCGLAAVVSEQVLLGVDVGRHAADANPRPAH